MFRADCLNSFKINFAEAFHRLIQLLPSIDHLLKLIDAVSIYNEFTPALNIPHIFERQILEVSQLMLVIFLDHLRDELLTVKHQLLLKWILVSHLLVHD